MSNQFATDGGESGGSWVAVTDWDAVAEFVDGAFESNANDEKVWEVKSQGIQQGRIAN